MLTHSSISAAERRLFSELHHILTRPGLIRGSLVEMGRTCGTRGCRCKRSAAQRHRALYVAVNVEGKRRMLYVPREWEGRVREWVDRYGQVRAMLEQLSLACIRRLQARKV